MNVEPLSYTFFETNFKIGIFLQKIIVDLEKQAIDFVKSRKPKHSVTFTRKSGKPVAIWVFWGECGELYTIKSIKNKKFPYFLKVEPIKLAYYDLLASALTEQFGAV